LTERRNYLIDCAGLAVIVAVTRVICRSRYLYDIDSVNFALALDFFSPKLHQPHPPGYFLYVCSGRVLQALFHDANDALVALSILASCAAVTVIYLLTRNWFGRRAALFAGGLFVFSPLCWFHGIVALTYIVEAFFSASVGYLCWRGYTGNPNWLIAAAVTLGVSAGFRPSSLLFLGLLWLFSLLKAGTRTRLLALAVLGVTLLAWGIPMLHAAGGLRTYFAALNLLWRGVPAKDAIGITSPILSLARMLTIIGVAVLCFGCGSAFVFRKLPAADPRRRQRIIFTWTWIGPGLLFFSFVFFLFVNSGYLLLLSPPLFAWLGAGAADWWGRARLRHSLKAACLAGAAALHVCAFLFGPWYSSLRSVRQFEADLSGRIAAVRQRFKPSDTLIVGFDSHFLGYRHAAYYLPEFLAVEYPPVSQPEGKRIFAVEKRRSELLAVLPVERFHDFVIFPLPDGGQYGAYRDKQQGRFPAGALISHGTNPVMFTGSIDNLRYLFPSGMLTRAADGRVASPAPRSDPHTGCIRTMTRSGGHVYSRSHVARGES